MLSEGSAEVKEGVESRWFSVETYGNFVMDCVTRTSSAVSGYAGAAVVPVSCGDGVAAGGRQLLKKWIYFGGKKLPFIFAPSVVVRGSLSIDIITMVRMKLKLCPSVSRWSRNHEILLVASSLYFFACLTFDLPH